MIRPARHVVGTFGTVALAIVIAACGSTATPAPTTGASQPAASQPAGASPSAATSQQPGTSITGITGAPELEAALPATLCGAPSKKGSVSGTGSVDASAPPNPFALFAGGGTATGAFAYAESTNSDCQTSAVAFSAAGGLATTIMGLMALGAGTSGGGPMSLGGKSVTKIPDDPTSTYFYAKGDTLFAVEAATDDDAAAALQQMP